MGEDRLLRVVRIMEGLRPCFDDHADRCGDRVVAVALSEQDFDELEVAELWGLPVLAWEEVSPGRVKLLCEANGTLIPEVDTVEDLQDIWNYRLQPPPVPEATRSSVGALGVRRRVAEHLGVDDQPGGVSDELDP